MKNITSYKLNQLGEDVDECIKIVYGINIILGGGALYIHWPTITKYLSLFF